MDVGGELRPGAQIRFSRTLREPEGLTDYLRTHGDGYTAAELRAELKR